jgi:RNA polymerase sigma factor (sigma-70 family)
MVREVSRRLLGQEADIEDVFQAVFLVLACKARSVRKRQSLASWLYGIAYRTALRLRRDIARRKSHERRTIVREPSDPVREIARREVWEALDAELYRLPEDQRAALVLCYLEGRTRDEAARQLGQSVRTLDRRLQRGRELLRRRLARRGVTLSAALLATGLTHTIARAGMPSSLAALTARAAAMITGQRMAGHEVSAEVIALVKGVLTNMFRTQIKIVTASLLALTFLGTATGIVAFRATAQDSAAQSQPSSPAAPAPAGAPAPAKPQPRPDVYALLLIEDSEPRLLPDARHPVPPRSDPASYRKTQTAYLLSRSIHRSALKRDEVKRLAIVERKTDPELWFGDNIETTFLNNSGVLRVSFGEGSPEERAVLINALVAAYMDDVVYAEQRERQHRLTDLEKALNASKAELRAKRESIRRLSEMPSEASSSFRQQSDREDLAQFRKELLRVRLEKVGAQARLKHRKSVERGDDKATLAKLEEEIAVFAAQEKLLKKDISSLNERTERLANAEANEREDLSSLRKQIAAEEKFNDDLADRIRIEQVELNAGPRVRLLQKAEAPRKREK